MDILIAGGGYAGIACALRLAQSARAAHLPANIRVINPRPSLVERIRLHQVATGQGLRERPVESLLRRAGVELTTASVDAIDPELRKLHVSGRAIGWDRLVLALGSRSGSQEVPGASDYACTLNPQSAPAAFERLLALPAGSIVTVVGGGLTGIEAASEIAESFPHLLVQLVSGGFIAQGFSPAGRAHVLSTLARLGVGVREQVRVRAVRPAHLETAAGRLDCDLCVWAAGFEFPALARQAGLRVNASGQVLVDPFLRSISHPSIYAAGDIAAPVLAPGQALPMGCKSALPMGVHAADNLLRELRGEAPRAFDYALLFYCVSLGRRDGLIQWADNAGQLTGRILTGRRAAWFKEMICRSTWWALVLEARGLKATVWKSTGQAPQQLPSREPAGT